MAVLVGRKAPKFNAKAVVKGQIVSDFSLDPYLGKKNVVLFFYPKDFTFVCPTEIIAFQKALPEFEARNTAIVGCSTDGEHSHWAWVNTPRNQGGIEGVEYPLVADTNKTISAAYDVLTGGYDLDTEGNLIASAELIAYRGLFLIDREGTVQHQLVNNLPLGRSTQECLRMIDALAHFEQHGEVCPINWQKGEQAMSPTREGVSAYLSQ